MGFGEFIGIVTRNPPRFRHRFRPNRELDEPGAIKRCIEYDQRGGMDHVLRIVQHHRTGTPARTQFVLAQRAVETV